MKLVCDSKSFKVTTDCGDELTPEQVGWCRLHICTGFDYTLSCTVNDKPVNINLCRLGMDEYVKEMVHDE